MSLASFDLLRHSCATLLRQMELIDRKKWILYYCHYFIQLISTRLYKDISKSKDTKISVASQKKSNVYNRKRMNYRKKLFVAILEILATLPELSLSQIVPHVRSVCQGRLPFYMWRPTSLSSPWHHSLDVQFKIKGFEFSGFL